MSKNENEFLVKFIVLGESNAGKSSIIECFLNEKFEENIIPTLGASFVRKEILVEKKKINIWNMGYCWPRKIPGNIKELL